MKKGKNNVVKQNTIIKINGKRYDAVTGSDLDQPTKQRVSKSIDGVVGGRKIATRPAAVTAVAKPLAASDVPRSIAAHAKAHGMTPSKTLMRSAVQKPATTSLKRRSKVQTSTLAASHALHVSVTPKTSIQKVNHQRLARAGQVSAHIKVAHFATKSVLPGVTITLPVHDSTTLLIRPYRPDGPGSLGQAAPVTDIFEQALARATSHEEPAPTIAGKRFRAKTARQARQRMIGYSASAFAVLALLGFVGFHNVGGIQLKMAANKAGFAATMPSYHPTGFDVADISSTPGQVNLRFNGPSQPSGVGSTFSVTEKPSNWNSSTLLTNIVADASGSAYNTIETAGRTVYVYGSNQAAWVDNGILYQVLGNGLLNVQQFGKLAASM